jgi:hypothetical protein
MEVFIVQTKKKKLLRKRRGHCEAQVSELLVISFVVEVLMMPSLA